MSNDVKLEHLTRELISLENRTPREVFDIMCDRIRHAWNQRHQPQREAVLEEALRVAKREVQSLGCDPDDIELALNRINRAATIAKPSPARPCPS